MPKLIDLTGKKFNGLTVLEKVDNIDTKRYGTLWKCRCDCGNICVKTSAGLRKGWSKSCGCIPTYGNIVGKTFGELIVMEKLPHYYGAQSAYRCKCNCGGECIKTEHTLKTKKHIHCNSEYHKRNMVKFDDKYAYIYFKKNKNMIIIDKEDYPLVKQFSWQKTGNYAYTYDKQTKKTIMIHTLLMGKQEYGLDIDHIDGNPLNNSRANLRIIKHIHNCWNHSSLTSSESGYIGVSREKRTKEPRWNVYIKVNNKQIYLGYYKTFEDAVNARKDAEIKYFGEYRRK